MKMNPFKVRRLWKVTYQYGLDGMKRELNIHGIVLGLTVCVLAGLLVLAALYLFNLRGLGQTNANLARLKQENLQLRHKLDYYSGIVDSIYQKLDSMQMLDKRSGSSGRYYPFTSSGNGSIISDNTFVYDSYLDARVNAIELQLKQITGSVDLKPQASQYVATASGTDLLRIDNGPSIFPTFGRWSDGWGTRLHPFYHSLYFHYGVDIANKMGTPIYATSDGEVILTGYDQEYGKLVKIQHANGIETRYGHLYSFQVAQGDRVRKGQIIALMGSTGMSTGPHLHYEVLVNGAKVNPSRYLNRIDDAIYYAGK